MVFFLKANNSSHFGQIFAFLLFQPFLAIFLREISLHMRISFSPVDINDDEV